MRKIVLSGSVLLGCFVFAITSCSNNRVNNNNIKAVEKLASFDAQLLNKAYQTLMLSVKMAEEANTRSVTPEARQLAQEIVREHSSMMDQLEDIAGKHAAELPLDVTSEQLKKWKQLVREKGLPFDKKFAEVIQEEHKEVRRLFSAMENKAVNKDLQVVSASILRTAEEHSKSGFELEEALANRRSRDSIVALEITAKN